MLLWKENMRNEHAGIINMCFYDSVKNTKPAMYWALY